MNINLHIERLALKGLSMAKVHSAATQAAVETELVRLLTEEGLPRMSAGSVKNISGGQIQLTTKSNSTQTGQQIARAVYTALSPRRANAGPGGRSR
jgi:hypothetical protein